MGKLLEQLDEFYHRVGISAIDFKCPHFHECSSSDKTSFTTAKEAFVSSGYEKHELPSVLFLSLDSGTADSDPSHKTLASVRQQEEFENDVLTLPRHKHWYRTHEFAYLILREFKHDLKLEEAKHYFAHTNSAKCCQNKPERSQANRKLFENCRDFIRDEIEILAPDILITQGRYAEAVGLCFEQVESSILEDKRKPIPNEVRAVQISGKVVLWVHTFHPRNPNSKMNRDNYTVYVKIVYDFIHNKRIHFLPHKKTGGVNMMSSKYMTEESSPVPLEMRAGLNYIFLDYAPETPIQNAPTRSECVNFEFMLMTQLCNIAEKYQNTRSIACNAFGGDKGKYKVDETRMARAVMIGRKLRKFVLVSAVEEYFREIGINW